jgi:hypothetical protein
LGKGGFEASRAEARPLRAIDSETQSHLSGPANGYSIREAGFRICGERGNIIDAQSNSEVSRAGFALRFLRCLILRFAGNGQLRRDLPELTDFD